MLSYLDLRHIRHISTRREKRQAGGVGASAELAVGKIVGHLIMPVTVYSIGHLHVPSLLCIPTSAPTFSVTDVPYGMQATLFASVQTRVRVTGGKVDRHGDGRDLLTDIGSRCSIQLLCQVW